MIYRESSKEHRGGDGYMKENDEVFIIKKESIWFIVLLLVVKFFLIFLYY